MKRTHFALLIALGAATLAASASTLSALERTRLSDEAFESSRKLTRGLVSGLRPGRSLYLAKQEVGHVVQTQVADRALQARLAKSYADGVLAGAVFRKVRYTPSSRLYDLVLLYDGHLTGVLVQSGSWQAGDGSGDGGPGGDGDGGNGGEEPEQKVCPYYYCNIQGQQCECTASTILVPEGDSCPAVDSNCCADFLCDETPPGGGTAPPSIDDIF